jgi:hypothetical protein
VWSLGCIFAEALTFAFRGKEGVQEFIASRSTAYNSQSFHTGLWEGGFKPEVKPEVVSWLAGLAPDVGKLASQFVAVLTMMLNAEPTERPKSDWVVQMLGATIEDEKQRLQGVHVNNQATPESSDDGSSTYSNDFSVDGASSQTTEASIAWIAWTHIRPLFVKDTGLQASYSDARRIQTVRAVERNLSRFLKDYCLALEKSATKNSERDAIKLIRRRRRVVAADIGRLAEGESDDFRQQQLAALSSQPPQKSEQLEKFLQQHERYNQPETPLQEQPGQSNQPENPSGGDGSEDEGDASESDADSVALAELNQSKSNIDQIKDFLISSEAFATLKSEFQTFAKLSPGSIPPPMMEDAPGNSDEASVNIGGNQPSDAEHLEITPSDTQAHSNVILAHHDLRQHVLKIIQEQPEIFKPGDFANLPSHLLLQPEIGIQQLEEVGERTDVGDNLLSIEQELQTLPSSPEDNPPAPNLPDEAVSCSRNSSHPAPGYVEECSAFVHPDNEVVAESHAQHPPQVLLLDDSNIPSSVAEEIFQGPRESQSTLNSLPEQPIDRFKTMIEWVLGRRLVWWPWEQPLLAGHRREYWNCVCFHQSISLAVSDIHDRSAESNFMKMSQRVIQAQMHRPRSPRRTGTA